MPPLNDEDLRYLKAEFVTKAECEAKQDKVQSDIASMREDMAKMCTKQDLTNKWLGIIGGAMITALIGLAITFVKYVILGTP